ncbi:MAG TPA: thiamine-phosphate kinase [Xanthomonadaceae bacterium]|nr:thiamine-phosphate kinase [Xanthomonadaceae bacterium]
MPEFELIERIRARASTRSDVALGIGDDGALLDPPPGMQLVAVVDTLVSGIHFPAGTQAADIGWKALAVNLSDLAAMGAEPAWALLSLTLPRDDKPWLDRFLDGFLELADRHRVALVGGDTTRGPLAVSVQLVGFVPRGQALLRSGARPGDRIWVTGTLGDAAAGLDMWPQRVRSRPEMRPLFERLHRPQPRVEAGIALRGHAHAAIDISDGLLADLGHVCRASAVGAEVYASHLPSSSALAGLPVSRRQAWQLTGGDDYELLFALPVDVDAGPLMPDALAVTEIGHIVAEPGVRVLDAEGRGMRIDRTGYRHFEGPK